MSRLPSCRSEYSSDLTHPLRRAGWLSRRLSASAKFPFLFAVPPLSATGLYVPVLEKMNLAYKFPSSPAEFFCPNAPLGVYGPNREGCRSRSLPRVSRPHAGSRQPRRRSSHPAFCNPPRVIWLFLSDYSFGIKICKCLSCGLVNNCLKNFFSRSLSTDFISLKKKQNLYKLIVLTQETT